MAYAFLVPLAGGDPIPLVKESVVVGRRPEADIRLEIPNVSGRHAELRLQRGAWWVIDLDSANGTKVNGDKIKKKKLAPGDEVVFARTNKFKIEFDPVAAANAAKPKTSRTGKEFDDERRAPQSWDKAGIRGRRPAKALTESDDDADVLAEEIEKESGFDKSLLEKAGLSKKSKIIDEELDDDLADLDELEELIDEPPSKPKKPEK